MMRSFTRIEREGTVPDADDFDVEELRKLIRGEGSCPKPPAPAACPARGTAGAKKAGAKKAGAQETAAKKSQRRPETAALKAPAAPRARRGR
jgi:hypothetical protein